MSGIYLQRFDRNNSVNLVAIFMNNGVQYENLNNVNLSIAFVYVQANTRFIPHKNKTWNVVCPFDIGLLNKIK